MQRATLVIDGMSCEGCVTAVRRVLGSTEGVKVGVVSVGTATVELDDARVTEAVLHTAIDDAGFTLRAITYG